jgi:flagellar biosynthetic protein FliR
MNIGLIDLFTTWSVSLVLIMVRVSAMFFAFPFFGSPAIATRIRIMIALVVCFVLLPMVGVQDLGQNWGLGRLVLAVGSELIVGLTVGYGSKFMFEAFTVAGTFAGRQMGFAMADLVDPVTAAPQSMVGQFWALVAVLFFLSLDGHLFLIRLIMRNYEIVPLATGTLQPATGRTLILGYTGIFEIALRLAAPALLLTMMMDIGIAIMSRAMPRLQIFFVALPLKLFVGVFSLVVSLQLFQAIFSELFIDFQEYLARLLTTMG